MPNRFQKIILFSVFSLLMIPPATSFAWHDYADHEWDWHGSGRDHAYSQYINLYYSPEYVSLSSFDPVAASFINYINYPRPVILTPASDPYASQLPIFPYDQFRVNIPNKSGGYTPVVIKRSGNGYVGPQGEYYTEFPSVAELKTMYGN